MALLPIEYRVYSDTLAVWKAATLSQTTKPACTDRQYKGCGGANESACVPALPFKKSNRVLAHGDTVLT
jgi:hypothetical protein